MVKDSRYVIFVSGLFHILVGFYLSGFAITIALGAAYFLYAVMSKNKNLEAYDENTEVASLLTLITSLFGLLLNYQTKPLFLTYIILTLLSITIGVSFIKHVPQLKVYCAYTGILSILFSLEIHDASMVAAFMFSLAFVYMLTQKRIRLQESDVRQKTELNKLIKCFPDVLIKKVKDKYHSVNAPDFVVSTSLKHTIEDMLASKSMLKDSFEMDGKFYDITINMAGSDGEVILFLREVTDKILQQRELEENRTKLTNSSKLAALGEMAGGVAHEINNPLQILSLSNEQMRMLLMNDDLNLSRSECEKLCDQMESTIDRVTDIVKGMKLISRDGHQDAYESLNLKEVVEDTLSLCREKFHNHGVKLYFYEDQGINDLVMAQKVRLSQVILNLLNNAFDAIQPNSSKIIRVYLGKTKSDHVSLSVSDNGAGVPEELIDKVFQPFFTTKDIGKGTGLGLSISKGIIEQHNGNFFIDKEDHSKFVIELPEIKENQNA